MASINNTTPPNRPLPDGELAVDITRPNRQLNDAVFKETEARRVHEAEQRARESMRSLSPDRVEVSSEARLMLARNEASRKDEATERRERTAELRQQYLEGKLVTNERVEKAAEKLLGA
ncbi:MAG: flagellar biosynthesis anti-sigma factor FlgM [Planctomycetota bacterium]|nr:flagellar biosynthesis anti-sigma factor FlgM [Planctomycetota bacterium]